MNALLGPVPGRQDNIQVPTLWVAIALSLLLPVVAMFGWLPKLEMLPFDEAKSGKPIGTLAVRIAPPPSRPPSAAVPPPPPLALARPTPASRTAAPLAQPRPAPAPRVIALDSPSPSSSSSATPAESARPPVEDLAALIAARRRARDPGTAAPPSPAETEQERHNRVVAENLGLNRTPTFGTNPDRGGGVFQVRSVSLDYAEFAFFGWNKEIKRNSLQTIEVRRGNNPSIELAVARRIIEVIRDHATGDFMWESPRSGRGVWLSARAADSAGLEEFMLKEFFPAYRGR